MPRIKIDYIVSFSSEDKENPASNLLSWEINNKKWLCKEGEPSCSVVLQLPKAILIESVNIGAYHAAFVEVLVGLSEKPDDQYEVLVPSSAFTNAADSRRGQGADRVRSFRVADQAPASLASGTQAAGVLTAAAARRWDRVRVVCSQPYNRHCKYGLSFVHLHSAGGSVAGGSVAPERLQLAALSDEEDFRPGELFAAANSPPNSAPTTTDAQIRLASSEALKNISDSSTKLQKTTINKDKSHCKGRNPVGASTSRQRENLIYIEEDDRPHKKIDRLVQAHRDQKSKEQGTSRKRSREDTPVRDTKREKLDGEKRKDRPTDNKKTDAKTQKTTKEVKRNEGRGALAGVVFALSGFVNPERAALRALAQDLGARYEPHDVARCTHLICAFPNTPRARALPPGGTAVRGVWLQHCARAAARLPELAYAPHLPAPAPPPLAPTRTPSPAPSPTVTDEDTDDEIEKVLRENGALEAGKGGNGGGNHTDDSGEETAEDEPPPRYPHKELPAPFAGAALVLPRGARRLARHVRAGGGLVLQPHEVDADTEVSATVGRDLSPKDLWTTISRTLLPTTR